MLLTLQFHILCPVISQSLLQCFQNNRLQTSCLNLLLDQSHWGWSLKICINNPSGWFLWMATFWETLTVDSAPTVWIIPPITTHPVLWQIFTFHPLPHLQHFIPAPDSPIRFVTMPFYLLLKCLWSQTAQNSVLYFPIYKSTHFLNKILLFQIPSHIDDSIVCVCVCVCTCVCSSKFRLHFSSFLIDFSFWTAPKLVIQLIVEEYRTKYQAQC